MPRVREFNVNTAIEKAMELFWEKGYFTTSLTDLTNTLELGKGSFYSTFKSKRNLFNLCLEYYLDMRLTQMRQILSTYDDSLVGLKDASIIILDSMIVDDKKRGCFYVNTCSEMAGSDPEISTRFQVFHHDLKSSFLEFIKKNNWEYNVDKEVFLELVMTFVTGMKQQIKYDNNRQNYISSINKIFDLLQ